MWALALTAVGLLGRLVSNVRVDLHVHLHPFSRTSDFGLEAYASEVERNGLRVITVTDYGTAAAAYELEKRLGGVLVVYGAEVATHEGQFLIYNADRRYFDTVQSRYRSLEDIPRNDGLAIVWAHPRMPWRSGWRAPFPRQPLTKFILERVDAVEFYNGAMLGMAHRGAVESNYHDDLREQVERWKVAAVGGSACSTADAFLSAWTVFPPVRTAKDFVTAIKDRAVKPGAVLSQPHLSLASV